MTTTAAKNIQSSANPAENKCPEESSGWLYIVIAGIVVCVVIVGVLAWFWRKRHSEEKKLIVKHEEELYALYQSEAKVKGPKNMRSFDGWKVNVSLKIKNIFIKQTIFKIFRENITN